MMGVKIHSKGSKKTFPLTSPPPEPTHGLNQNWIASEINYGDRILRVSHPFPDKLNLVSDLSDSMCLVPDISGKSDKHLYYQLDHQIRTHLMHYPQKDGGLISLSQLKGKKQPYGAVFSLGPPKDRLARIELQRRMDEKYPIWKLILSLNPRKVGPDNMLLIPELFEEALWMLDFYIFLASAHITRVDCAIDITGARPIDLICRIEKPGKRAAYLNDDYGPESFYWFEHKKSPKLPPKSSNYKSQGPTRLLVYERMARALQHGLQPPCGKTPVTRVEMKHMWKGSWHPFSSLPDLKNLIIGREVACANRPELGSSPHWRELCQRSWIMGPNNLSFQSPLSKNLQLLHRYQTMKPDLVSEENWSGWEEGLKLTGITDLLYNLHKNSEKHFPPA